MEEQIQEQLAEIKQSLAELKSDASTHATQEDLKKYYTKTDIDKKQYISAIPKEYVQDHELETIMENWDAQLNLESYATKDYVNQQIDNIEFPTYTPPTVEANVSYASQVSGDNTYVLGILTSGSNQYPIVGLKFTESGGGTGGGEIEIPEPEPAISPIFIFSANSTLNRQHEGIPTEWSTNIASVTTRPVYMSTARQKGEEYLRWDDGYVWTEPVQIIAANIVPESKPSSPNTVVLTEKEFNDLKESGTLTPNTLYIIKDDDGNILYMVTTDSDGNVLTTVKILTPQAQSLSEKITLEKWNELKANGELDRNKIYIVTSDDGSVVYGIGVATVLTKIPEPNPTPEMPDVLSEITKIFSQHATFDEDGKLQTLKWSIMDSSVPGEWYASTGFRNAVNELISTAGFVSTADLESATSEMYAYVDDISATIKTEVIGDESFVKAVADEIDLTANETIKAQAQRITEAESNISALTITTNEISSSVQNISDGIVKASTIDQTDNSITLSVMQADETGETSASVGILKLYNDPDNISNFYLAADHVKFETEDYENVAKHVTFKAEDYSVIASKITLKPTELTTIAKNVQFKAEEYAIIADNITLTATDYEVIADKVKFDSDAYDIIASKVTINADNIDLQGLVNALDKLTVGGNAAIFNSDGTGSIANGNISWDADGNMGYWGSINAKEVVVDSENYTQYFQKTLMNAPENVRPYYAYCLKFFKIPTIIHLTDDLIDGTDRGAQLFFPGMIDGVILNYLANAFAAPTITELRQMINKSVYIYNDSSLAWAFNVFASDASSAGSTAMIDSKLIVKVTCKLLEDPTRLETIIWYITRCGKTE